MRTAANKGIGSARDPLAFRHDRRCLAFAHAGAAGDAERNHRCEQRDYKLLHVSPPRDIQFDPTNLRGEWL